MSDPSTSDRLDTSLSNLRATLLSKAALSKAAQIQAARTVSHVHPVLGLPFGPGSPNDTRQPRTLGWLLGSLRQRWTSLHRG